MPHVIVKLWPGTSERQKIRLAETIVRRKWVKQSVDAAVQTCE